MTESDESTDSESEYGYLLWYSVILWLIAGALAVRRAAEAVAFSDTQPDVVLAELMLDMITGVPGLFLLAGMLALAAAAYRIREEAKNDFA